PPPPALQAMPLPLTVERATRSVENGPLDARPVLLLTAVERTSIRLAAEWPALERTAKAVEPLLLTTLSVTVALTVPVLLRPLTAMPLPRTLCASTRVKTALTVPAPVGSREIPRDVLSATNVFEIAMVLAPLGRSSSARPCTLRTTQFSMVRLLPLLSWIPRAPT